MRQKKQKWIPTEQEMIETIRSFDKLVLKNQNLTDEELSRFEEMPEYVKLHKAENFFHCRGMRRVNTTSHEKGLRDLERASLLREYLAEVSAFYSARVCEFRETDSWTFNYLSPFMRWFQEDQKKFLISIIPFDLEHFGKVFCYSGEQRQYLLHLAASGSLPAEIAGMLTHHEVLVDPWIWKERRKIEKSLASVVE